MTLDDISSPSLPMPPSWTRHLIQSQLRLLTLLKSGPRVETSLSLADFLKDWRQFWRSPHSSQGPALRRRQYLIALLRRQSWLIAQQSPLSATARAVVNRCVTPPAQNDATSLKAYAIGLSFHEGAPMVRLSGMFVLRDESTTDPTAQPGQLLLADTGQSWHAFDSFAELRQHAALLFADQEGRERLLARLPLKHRNRVPADLGSFLAEKLRLAPNPSRREPFSHLATGLLKQQRQNIAQQIRINRSSGAATDTGLNEAASLVAGINIRAVAARHFNPQAAAYGALSTRLLEALPDLHQQARNYMRQQVFALNGTYINPDRIWLHYFDAATSSHQTFTGWEHHGTPRRSLTLTQLALSNFTVDDEHSSPGALDQVAGLYTDGADAASRFAAHNEVRLLPSQLMNATWKHDFYTRYQARLDAFWTDHSDEYRTLLKGRFIASCRDARHRQGLSREEYQSLMSLVGGEPDPSAPLTLERLRERLPVTSAEVRSFDLYGYPATDILHITPANGREYLWVPEAHSATLHVFPSSAQLRTWVEEQARSPDLRAALASHFSLYLRQDGKAWSGVDSALAGLAKGTWNPETTIDHDSTPLHGDIFDNLTQRARHRQDIDASTMITSNKELSRALWIADLSGFEQIALPLVPLGWPIGLGSAAAGMALFGLGLDMSLNADSLAERKQGSWTTFYATLDLLFSAGGTSPAAETFVVPDEPVEPAPFSVPEDQLQGYTADADGVYRLDNNAWYVRCESRVYRVAVRNVRDKVDVIHPHGETADTLFSLRRIGTSERWARLELKGGKPQGENPWVRQQVRTQSSGSNKVFSADIGGYHKQLCYDLKENAFRIMLKDSFTQQWTLLDSRLYRPVETGMIETTPGAEVSNCDRMATLKALDLDVELPLDMPEPSPKGELPLPPRVFSVWIGDRPISAELIRNLENNASIAAKGSTPSSMTLYLSSEHPEVFAHNQAALAKDAPTVNVVELETSPFYQHLRQTPYFAQYRAAVEGNGGVARNYSAASDVLRYPVINYHGGLYLDVDDTLTEAWANAGLRVAPGELLLNEPVSNSVLGLDIGFNTSCFGSHAGNPLLDAISARSHERWLAAPDLFSEPRPVFQGSGDQRFGDYMKRISHVTGPGMLNDVLAEHSPALVRVRTVSRLLGSSVLIPEPLIRSIKRLVKMTCPLRDVVRIGADHSWRTTR